MNIKENAKGFFKEGFFALKSFFTKQDKATREALTGLDYADISISLAPIAVFGSLLFGFRALLVLLICAALPLGVDFLWNLIFLKQKSKPDYTLALSGLVLGLTLSSKLNIFLVLATAVLNAVVLKLLPRLKLWGVVLAPLAARVIMGTIFFGAFDIYSFPFMTEITQTLPLDYIFKTYSFVFPAKHLFFGIHSGNIGETSVLLLLVGGIYLMLRKIINPVIPTCFIATAGLLSLVFSKNVSVSLMGGSLFFAALFLTLDYNFKTAPRYKKILYGVCCGVLTFVIRELFHTEGALYAVAITHLAFVYINRQVIKRVADGIKAFVVKIKLKEGFAAAFGFAKKLFSKIDFKGLWQKAKAVFVRKV